MKPSRLADLHLVEAAAPRLHAERAEKRVLRLLRLDGNDLGATPPTAQRDLVLVGSPPPLQRRRSIQHDAGFSSHTAFFLRS